MYIDIKISSFFGLYMYQQRHSNLIYNFSMETCFEVMNTSLDTSTSTVYC